MSFATFLAQLPTLTDDCRHLDGEALLRSNAETVLDILWLDWQEEALVPSPFSLDFFKFLLRHRDSIPVFIDALLLKRNPQFLAITREVIQQRFNTLLKNLERSTDFSPAALHRQETVIHNMLCFYVMFEPNPCEPLTLPRRIKKPDGSYQWQAVTFQVSPIELSPKKGWWRLFIDDDERVFSYGLSPIDADTPSILMHLGTSWRTGQGASLQILADLWPDKTPGEIFFEWGKAEMDRWIAQQASLTSGGLSLGGALGYLTAMAYPDKVTHSYCLNPPGMPYVYDETHPLFGAWFKTDNRPKVTIQQQQGDPISQVGVFAKDFTLLKIKRAAGNGNANAAFPHKYIIAHARSFATNKQVVIEPADMALENIDPSRQRNNDYIYGPGRKFIFYTQLLPFFFISKPVLNFAYRHFWQLLLFSVGLTLSLFILPLGLVASLPFFPVISSALLGSIIQALAFSQVMMAMATCIDDLASHQAEKMRAWWTQLKEATPSQATAQCLYLMANGLSLGLLSLAINAFNALILRSYHLVTHKNQHACEIHREDYLLKACDYDNYARPSLALKIQLVISVSLFFLIIWPLKLILSDLPSMLFIQFPKALANCFKQKTAMLNAAVPLTSTTPPPSQTPPPTVYQPLFTARTNSKKDIEQGQEPRARASKYF